MLFSLRSVFLDEFGAMLAFDLEDVDHLVDDLLVNMRQFLLGELMDFLWKKFSDFVREPGGHRIQNQSCATGVHSLQ